VQEIRAIRNVSRSCGDLKTAHNRLAQDIKSELSLFTSSLQLTSGCIVDACRVMSARADLTVQGELSGMAHQLSKVLDVLSVPGQPRLSLNLPSPRSPRLALPPSPRTNTANSSGFTDLKDGTPSAAQQQGSSASDLERALPTMGALVQEIHRIVNLMDARDQSFAADIVPSTSLIPVPRRVIRHARSFSGDLAAEVKRNIHGIPVSTQSSLVDPALKSVVDAVKTLLKRNLSREQIGYSEADILSLTEKLQVIYAVLLSFNNRLAV
jgi:hypothetical protein